MNTNEVYQVWIVVKDRCSWDGRKFSSGFHDAKLFGMQVVAQRVATKHGAEVQPFKITGRDAEFERYASCRIADLERDLAISRRAVELLRERNENEAAKNDDDADQFDFGESLEANGWAS